MIKIWSKNTNRNQLKANPGFILCMECVIRIFLDYINILKDIPNDIPVKK